MKFLHGDTWWRRCQVWLSYMIPIRENMSFDCGQSFLNLLLPLLLEPPPSLIPAAALPDFHWLMTSALIAFTWPGLKKHSTSWLARIMRWLGLHREYEIYPSELRGSFHTTLSIDRSRIIDANTGRDCSLVVLFSFLSPALKPPPPLLQPRQVFQFTIALHHIISLCSEVRWWEMKKNWWIKGVGSWV